MTIRVCRMILRVNYIDNYYNICRISSRKATSTYEASHYIVILYENYVDIYYNLCRISFRKVIWSSLNLLLNM